jgi:asparagine synthase (glutamine-hydrolysing)
MCGIAGRYNFFSGAPVQAELLKSMCDFLAHRGPDGEGIYQKNNFGFGHRRLAVIDLTEAAQQPMVRENGRFVITYNGEIYNFQELRRNLETLGHRFYSQSDTEVVLASYQEYGTKCVEYLRGMFAFGIWDEGEKRLFLARDRVGKKPLYYWIDQDGISFASEPKAFLADSNFKSEVNIEAISHYLTYQYVPSPWSAFQGVQKLPPAHVLIVQKEQINIERYWKLSYSTTFSGSFEDAQQELLAKLKEATRLRLISDVPLGAFLSGGIDSSVIVALMAKLGVAHIKTFSIGFEEKAYNELPFARLVAQQYDTDHHELTVTPKATEMFQKLVWFYNEPFADSSAIPTLYLSEMTKRHVTVALNGDGGDENLLGYDRYVASLYGSWYDRLPKPIRRILEWGTHFLPDASKSKTILSRLKRFVAVLSETPERRYGYWLSHFDPILKQHLCTEEFLRKSGESDSFSLLVDAFQNSDAKNFLNRLLDVDVNMYLPDDLLVKVDIASMAHGLEARSPFLDHHVMEFCATLPSSMKLKGRDKKYVLKQAVRSLLPDEILNRPKMGFGVPLDHWFRHDLREMAYDLLLSPRAIHRGYFHKHVVETLLDEHVSGVKNWHYRLWNLLMLELWHLTYIDGDRDLVVAGRYGNT